jgi:large subunit ribosomal protein L18
VSLLRKLKQRKNRRKLRVRKSVTNGDMPRVSVFRSAKHIYGQLINNDTGRIIAAYSTLQMKEDIKGDKKAEAHAIGVELAKLALSEGVLQAAFDRGPFLYHGRVKAFADGLREGGLKI